MSLAAIAGAFALVGCDSGGSKPGEGQSAAAAPAQSDWTKSVVATPEGGFRMGNPDARVKIVEFASYTCPHCKEFHHASSQTLKLNYVKSGNVSYEYRPFMLNIYDFAAALLATCESPAKSMIWTDELYMNHDDWVQPFATLTEVQIAPLRALAPDKQVHGLAIAGGLHEFARARGMTRARFDQCLSDQPRLEKMMNAQQAAQTKYEIQGTPSFLINGRKVEGTDWKTIEPQLKAALG